MAKSNESLSISKKKIVHGVEIQKMPCGKYFEALQTLKDLPEDFIKELSKDNPNFKLSDMMSVEGITELVMRLLIILPDFTFSFLSILLDIDEDIMRNKLTPKELLDIITEFWKMNELESFFVQMKPIVQKILMQIGFKKQSQSASKLASVKKSS